MPIPPPPISVSPLYLGWRAGRGVCHIPTVLVFIRHVHHPALCGARCAAADSTACCLCPSPRKSPRCQLCLGSAQGALHGSEPSPWPLHQASAGSSCQTPPCGPGRPTPCRAACPPPGCLPGAPAQAAPTGVLSCPVSSSEAEGEARSPLILESPEPGWAPGMHRSLCPGALSNGLDGEHPLCPCHSSLPRSLRYAVLDAGLLSQVKRVSGRVGNACSNSAGQLPPKTRTLHPPVPSSCGKDVLGGSAKSLQ